jgi:hypothetical protein
MACNKVACPNCGQTVKACKIIDGKCPNCK